MNIIEQLKIYIKKNNIKLAKVAEDTSIPYHRMHKWISGEGMPKAEDSKTLDDYINRETSNKVKEPEPKYVSKSDEFMKMLERTLVIIESQQQTIHSQQSTIRELTTGHKAKAISA